ncbi:13023_t:CDS:2 [Ambispora leptoticha]|uniref:13023_t:CDS:1 n=1 Tax=Ambispora leptoticha TaxID=144679 RepID=A0A9N9FG05_9GLOM|nr:13023_t:CDS:2 [Ambispora leptoticha]
MSSQNSQPPKPKSALDVAVNQLVRASIGGVPPSLPDEDLDKYVADLIMKEAAAKNKLFNKEGIRAYLPNTGAPPSNLPKPNKRFLFNIVKSTDDHNQALIRKEEEEAAKKYTSWVNRLRSSDKQQAAKIAESTTSTIYKDTSPKVIFKGRGETSDGSKMDKYFRKDYDPMHDIEPFLGNNGWFINYAQFEGSLQKGGIDDKDDANDKTKKSKKKNKHKKKHHRHHKKEKSSKHNQKKSHKSEHSGGKSKRKRKTQESSDSYDSDDDSDYSTNSFESGKKSKQSRRKRYKKDNQASDEDHHDKKTKIVREWDMPKLANGSWYLEQIS